MLSIISTICSKCCKTRNVCRQKPTIMLKFTVHWRNAPLEGAMALNHIDFKENKEINLLKPCWIAGNKKYSTTQFVKQFARHEINAIDVVASW